MTGGPIFVDTWGWMALGHRRDPHHREVTKLYQAMLGQRLAIYTSDYVLDELVTLLFRREVFDEAVRFMEGLLAAVELGHVMVERVTSNRFVAAWALRKRFHDKPAISFTDLTSLAIMAELRISRVLTEDEHFLQVGMHLEKVP